jgi:hypothetical protein
VNGCGDAPALLASQHDVDRLAASIRRHGFGSLHGSLPPQVLAAMQAEARELMAEAARAERTAPLSYRASVSPLGPVGRGLLHGAAMSHLLTHIFGGRFELAENISCVSRYDAGDHLGAHRDTPAHDCAVTVIIYLVAQSPDAAASDTGLVLNVYGRGDDGGQALSLRIPTAEGVVVLGRGSSVWHGRPRLQAGERVVAITGCYRYADPLEIAGDAAVAVEVEIDRSILLDIAAVDGDLEQELRRIFRSTTFRLVPPDRVRLDGADISHHRHDPEIPAVLQDSKNLKWFRRSTAAYDLCCEDSWSGVFIAEQLEKAATDEACVVIHVDDHQDMGPTLLVQDGDRLVNPATGAAFDPGCPRDWAAAIAAGAIGIGNFLTPLVFQSRPLHVRHLADGWPAEPPAGLRREALQYPLTGALRFAGLGKAPTGASSKDTYARSADPRRLLADLPAGLLLVHIDLDYFVNDFNGNPGGQAIDVDRGHRCRVIARMERLFEAIAASGRPVARWIVATSPGFCAYRHWSWLLQELGARIAAGRGRPG